MFKGEHFAAYAGCLKCSLEKEREIQFYGSIWTKGVEAFVQIPEIFKSRKTKPQLWIKFYVEQKME